MCLLLPVVCCCALQVSEDESIGADVPRKVMSFAGPGVTLPILLTYAGRGGQVILSERAWDAVKPVVTQHPGAHTVISLGTHVVSTDYPVPMLLVRSMNCVGCDSAGPHPCTVYFCLHALND
jgi:hypothetical protein